MRKRDYLGQFELMVLLAILQAGTTRTAFLSRER
jgi:hypothetical protein